MFSSQQGRFPFSFGKIPTPLECLFDWLGCRMSDVSLFVGEKMIALLGGSLLYDVALFFIRSLACGDEVM